MDRQVILPGGDIPVESLGNDSNNNSRPITISPFRTTRVVTTTNNNPLVVRNDRSLNSFQNNGFGSTTIRASPKFGGGFTTTTSTTKPGGRIIGTTYHKRNVLFPSSITKRSPITMRRSISSSLTPKSSSEILTTNASGILNPQSSDLFQQQLHSNIQPPIASSGTNTGVIRPSIHHATNGGTEKVETEKRVETERYRSPSGSGSADRNKHRGEHLSYMNFSENKTNLFSKAAVSNAPSSKESNGSAFSGSAAAGNRQRQDSSLVVGNNLFSTDRKSNPFATGNNKPNRFFTENKSNKLFSSAANSSSSHFEHSAELSLQKKVEDGNAIGNGKDLDSLNILDSGNAKPLDNDVLSGEEFGKASSYSAKNPKQHGGNESSESRKQEPRPQISPEVPALTSSALRALVCRSSSQSSRSNKKNMGAQFVMDYFSPSNLEEDGTLDLDSHCSLDDVPMDDKKILTAHLKGVEDAIGSSSGASGSQISVLRNREARKNQRKGSCDQDEGRRQDLIAIEIENSRSKSGFELKSNNMKRSFPNKSESQSNRSESNKINVQALDCNNSSGLVLSSNPLDHDGRENNSNDLSAPGRRLAASESECNQNYSSHGKSSDYNGGTSSNASQQGSSPHDRQQASSSHHHHGDPQSGIKKNRKKNKKSRGKKKTATTTKIINPITAEQERRRKGIVNPFTEAKGIVNPVIEVHEKNTIVNPPSEEKNHGGPNSSSELIHGEQVANPAREESSIISQSNERIRKDEVMVLTEKAVERSIGKPTKVLVDSSLSSAEKWALRNSLFSQDVIGDNNSDKKDHSRNRSELEMGQVIGAPSTSKKACGIKLSYDEVQTILALTEQTQNKVNTQPAFSSPERRRNQLTHEENRQKQSPARLFSERAKQRTREVLNEVSKQPYKQTNPTMSPEVEAEMFKNDKHPNAEVMSEDKQTNPVQRKMQQETLGKLDPVFLEKTKVQQKLEPEDVDQVVALYNLLKMNHIHGRAEFKALCLRHGFDSENPNLFATDKSDTLIKNVIPKVPSILSRPQKDYQRLFKNSKERSDSSEKKNTVYNEKNVKMWLKDVYSKYLDHHGSIPLANAAFRKYREIIREQALAGCLPGKFPPGKFPPGKFPGSESEPNQHHQHDLQHDLIRALDLVSDHEILPRIRPEDDQMSKCERMKSQSHFQMQRADDTNHERNSNAIPNDRNETVKSLLEDQDRKNKTGKNKTAKSSSEREKSIHAPHIKPANNKDGPVANNEDGPIDGKVHRDGVVDDRDREEKNRPEKVESGGLDPPMLPLSNVLSPVSEHKEGDGVANNNASNFIDAVPNDATKTGSHGPTKTACVDAIPNDPTKTGSHDPKKTAHVDAVPNDATKTGSHDPKKTNDVMKTGNATNIDDVTKTGRPVIVITNSNRGKNAEMTLPLPKLPLPNVSMATESQNIPAGCYPDICFRSPTDGNSVSSTPSPSPSAKKQILKLSASAREALMVPLSGEKRRKIEVVKQKEALFSPAVKQASKLDSVLVADEVFHYEVSKEGSHMESKQTSHWSSEDFGQVKQILDTDQAKGSPLLMQYGTPVIGTQKQEVHPGKKQKKDINSPKKRKQISSPEQRKQIKSPKAKKQIKSPKAKKQIDSPKQKKPINSAKQKKKKSSKKKEQVTSSNHLQQTAQRKDPQNSVIELQQEDQKDDHNPQQKHGQYPESKKNQSKSPSQQRDDSSSSKRFLNKTETADPSAKRYKLDADQNQSGQRLDENQAGQILDENQISEIKSLMKSNQVGQRLDENQVGKILNESRIGETLDNNQIGEVRNAIVRLMRTNNENPIPMSNGTASVWNNSASSVWNNTSAASMLHGIRYRCKASPPEFRDRAPKFRPSKVPQFPSAKAKANSGSLSSMPSKAKASSLSIPSEIGDFVSTNVVDDVADSSCLPGRVLSVAEMLLLQKNLNCSVGPGKSPALPSKARSKARSKTKGIQNPFDEAKAPSSRTVGTNAAPMIASSKAKSSAFQDQQVQSPVSQDKKPPDGSPNASRGSKKKKSNRIRSDKARQHEEKEQTATTNNQSPTPKEQASGCSVPSSPKDSIAPQSPNPFGRNPSLHEGNHHGEAPSSDSASIFSRSVWSKYSKDSVQSSSVMSLEGNRQGYQIFGNASVETKQVGKIPNLQEIMVAIGRPVIANKNMGDIGEVNDAAELSSSYSDSKKSSSISSSPLDPDAYDEFLRVQLETVDVRGIDEITQNIKQLLNGEVDIPLTLAMQQSMMQQTMHQQNVEDNAVENMRSDNTLQNTGSLVVGNDAKKDRPENYSATDIDTFGGQDQARNVNGQQETMQVGGEKSNGQPEPKFTAMRVAEPTSKAQAKKVRNAQAKAKSESRGKRVEVDKHFDTDEHLKEVDRKEEPQDGDQNVKIENVNGDVKTADVNDDATMDVDSSKEAVIPAENITTVKGETNDKVSRVARRKAKVQPKRKGAAKKGRNKGKDRGKFKKGQPGYRSSDSESIGDFDSSDDENLQENATSKTLDAKSSTEITGKKSPQERSAENFFGKTDSSSDSSNSGSGSDSSDGSSSGSRSNSDAESSDSAAKGMKHDVMNIGMNERKDADAKSNTNSRRDILPPKKGAGKAKANAVDEKAKAEENVAFKNDDAQLDRRTANSAERMKHMKPEQKKADISEVARDPATNAKAMKTQPQKEPHPKRCSKVNGNKNDPAHIIADEEKLKKHSIDLDTVNSSPIPKTNADGAGGGGGILQKPKAKAVQHQTRKQLKEQDSFEPADRNVSKDSVFGIHDRNIKKMADTPLKSSADAAQKPGAATAQQPSADTAQKPTADTSKKPEVDTAKKPRPMSVRGNAVKAVDGKSKPQAVKTETKAARAKAKVVETKKVKAKEAATEVVTPKSKAIAKKQNAKKGNPKAKAVNQQEKPKDSFTEKSDDESSSSGSSDGSSSSSSDEQNSDEKNTKGKLAKPKQSVKKAKAKEEVTRPKTPEELEQEKRAKKERALQQRKRAEALQKLFDQAEKGQRQLERLAKKREREQRLEESSAKKLKK